MDFIFRCTGKGGGVIMYIHVTCDTIVIQQYISNSTHILRRFPKIRRKVIEYAYVSGQCRQIIKINQKLWSVTLFTLLICCSRKKGFGRLFTFTIKALTNTYTAQLKFSTDFNMMTHFE